MWFTGRWVLVGLLVAGCHPEDSLTPQQLAVRTRQATERCAGGDAEQCEVSCKGNGPNAACQRGCERGNGEACLQLAARLEKGLDVRDPESPPVSTGPADDDRATDAYERACRLEVKQACRVASARILNGQGRGQRPSSAVSDLLKHGCNKLQDPESCCMMAQLNFRLAQARSALDVGIDFRAEGRKWAKIAGAYGGECPLPPGVNP